MIYMKKNHNKNNLAITILLKSVLFPNIVEEIF